MVGGKYWNEVPCRSLVFVPGYVAKVTLRSDEHEEECNPAADHAALRVKSYSAKKNSLQDVLCSLFLLLVWISIAQVCSKSTKDFGGAVHCQRTVLM